MTWPCGAAEDHEDDVMDINRDVHTWLEESEHSAESMQGAAAPWRTRFHHHERSWHVGMPL